MTQSVARLNALPSIYQEDDSLRERADRPQLEFEDEDLNTLSGIQESRNVAPFRNKRGRKVQDLEVYRQKILKTVSDLRE